MKHIHILLLILVLTTSTGLAQLGENHSGRGMGAQYGKMHKRGEGSQSMENLRIFLSMSDEQLERMENAIRQIRNMTPEEKDILRKKLNTYSSLPKHQQESMNQAWGQLDQKIKNAWRTYIDSLDQDELTELRNTMDALPHADRFKFRMNLLREKGLIDQDGG